MRWFSSNRKKSARRLTRAVVESMEPRRLLSSAGTVTGTVFSDPNQTGTLAGNSVVAGREVYVDLLGNGVFQDGDPAALTGANGVYTITGITPGTYAVRQVIPEGIGQTAPTNFDQLTTITAGQTATQNFGDLTLTTAGIGSTTSGTQTLIGESATTADAVTQPDGKVLVSGSNDTLQRFFPDGTPDDLFGVDGVADAPSVASGQTIVGVSVQPNGQIDVATTVPVSEEIDPTTTGVAYQLNPDGTVVAASVYVFSPTQFEGSTLLFSGDAYGPPESPTDGYTITMTGSTLLATGNEIVSGWAFPAGTLAYNGQDPAYAFATELDPATGQLVGTFGNNGTIGRNFSTDTEDGYNPNAFVQANPVGGFDVLFYNEIPAAGFQEVGSNGPFTLEGYDSSGNQTFIDTDSTFLDDEHFSGAVSLSVSGAGQALVLGLGFPSSVDSDGTPYLVASRFNTEGTVDTTYGTAGLAAADLGTSFGSLDGVSDPTSEVLPAGEVLLATDISVEDQTTGGEDTDCYAGEFDANGNLLTANGTDGVVDLGASGTNAPSFNSISGLVPSATASAAATPAGSATPAFEPGGVGFFDSYYPQPAVVFGSSAADLDVESTAPAATWQSPEQPTVTVAGSTAPQLLQVEFTDPVSVDPRTLGSGNLTVTMPGGTTEAVSYLGVQQTGDNQDVYADYTLPAPAGGWQHADNGTFEVNLIGGQVGNGAETTAGQAGIGSFAVDVPAVVDTTPPTAVFSPVASVTTTGVASLSISVTYADATSVSLASITAGDITVTSAGGAVLTVGSATTTATSSQATIAVTYIVTAPAGGFTSAANGTYTVALVAGKVADTLGNAVAASSLGTFVIDVPGADLTAPVAALTPVPSVTAATSASISVTVTYTDATAVSLASIGTGDIAVTGPAGTLAITAATTSATASAATIAVTYTVAAPAGGFTAGDNGTYTIKLVAGKIADTLGNAVTALTLGTFAVAVPVPDTTPPTAKLTSSPAVTAAGTAGVNITVTYTDATAVAIGSIGVGDVTVSGPAGDLSVTAATPGTVSSAASVTVVYTVAAPAGGFTTADDGTYTIALVAGKVADTLGNAVAGATLGTFTVAIGAPSASLAAVGAVTTAASPVTLTVTYTAASAAIQNSTVDTSDLTVTGPAGTLAVTAANLTAGSVATYTVSPPAGGFTAADNGIYTIELVAGQVTDTAGLAVPAQTLGTFTVAIPVTTSFAAAVSLSVPVTAVNTGNPIEFVATVTSADGSTAAVPTGTVSFYAGTDLLAVEPLIAGGVVYSTAALPAGTDAITAVYSGDSTFTTATSAATAVTVTGVVAGSPVLAPVLGAFPLPAEVVAGARHKISVPVVITNHGTQIEHGTVQVEIYASTDQALDLGDTLLTDLKIKVTLKAGRAVKATAHLNDLPVTLGSGTYYLLAEVVDAADFAQTVSTAGTVAVAAPFVSPGVSFFRGPATGIAGEKEKTPVTLAIANGGNVALTGPVTITVYLTADGAIDIASAVVTSAIRKVNIPAGKTLRIAISLGTIRSDLAGTFQLAAVVQTAASDGAPAVSASGIDPATIVLTAPAV